MDRLKEATTEQKKNGWNYSFNQLVDICKQVRAIHGVTLFEEDVDALIDVMVKLDYVTLTRENIPA
jgi:hypothetical protein